MSHELSNVDVLKERWADAKRALRLNDIIDGNFGCGGLGARLDDPSARLVILPADLESTRVEFDEETWNWWKQEWGDPVTGDRASWGSTTVTADAIVRYDETSKGSWGRYLALRRDGGLDLGLGSDGARSFSDRRYFWLIPIVGRMWAALSVYGHCVSRFSTPGPWELTLAMMNTRNAHLASVAEGWRDALSDGHDLKPIEDLGVLHSRIEREWPDEAGCQILAFRLGAVIDNAWGIAQRRFLNRAGEHVGEFGKTKYHWS